MSSCGTFVMRKMLAFFGSGNNVVSSMPTDGSGQDAWMSIKAKSRAYTMLVINVTL
jgi:hypothetical protein